MSSKHIYPRKILEAKQMKVYPNISNLHRAKALCSRHSPALGGTTVLASARTSRTVKYASTWPRLCAATFDVL